MSTLLFNNLIDDNFKEEIRHYTMDILGHVNPAFWTEFTYGSEFSKHDTVEDVEKRHTERLMFEVYIATRMNCSIEEAKTHIYEEFGSTRDSVVLRTYRK